MLRTTAAAKIKHEWLLFWAARRFGMLTKDPVLQSYTHEELQIEWFMHAIYEDPALAFSNEAGAVSFRTGDPVFDKWEELASEDKLTQEDLDEGVDPDILAKMKEWSKQRTRDALARVIPVTDSEPEPESTIEFKDEYDV